MSVYERVDLYGLCRLCMCVNGKLHDLYNSEECRDRQLPSKLAKCIPLQVKKNDVFPKGICEDCIEKIEEFYSFIDKCMKTQSSLKNYHVNLTDSDQLNCRKQVYVQQSIENNSNDEPLSPEKSIGSDFSSMLTMQSVSNLVQSCCSLQVDNNINGRCQEFCKHHNLQPTRTTNEVGTTECSDTIGDSSSQWVRARASSEKKATENVETIDSVPGASYSAQGDNEMNMFSSDYVTPLTVEPEILHFEFNKTESIDQDLDSNDSSKSDSDDENMCNWLPPTDGALQSCTSCGKVLESEEEIVMHNQMCTAVNTRNVQNLSKRRRARDMLPPRFPCGICNKIFKRKEHSVQHNKLHTGERPHICETCSKSFIRKEHLMRHKLTHTGQRMYQCNYCFKQFSRKDNLHKHRTTHGITGPFSCEICGKSFISKHFYDIHNAAHNEGDGQLS